MENEIRLIVEIPHERKPWVLVAYNDNDIISYANFKGFQYEQFTREEALTLYGEDSQIYDEILLSFKDVTKNEKIIQVCFRDYHDGDLYTEYDAPTELEAAKDCISYDLRNCYFLTVPEAKKFINEYRGHQKFEVIEAIKHELKLIS